ncbi:MAG: basic membrane protein A [Candidatus Promineifilaceae bacterium]|jgi:basic membrane protein A
MGEVDDHSFNQAGWLGVKRAKVDLLAQVEYIETASLSEISTGIEHFAEKNFDIIVTVGSSMTAITKRAAREYPDSHFVGIEQYGFEDMRNITGLVFPKGKAGFLAGVLAAGITETNIVGVVLPSNLWPESIEIREGFERGVHSISADTQVLSMHHPGSLFESFSDEEWGADAVRQMLDSGADVILSGGGTTGNGALIEAASQGNVFCIGFGADQWLDILEARNCLVSSVMEDISNEVFGIIARVSFDLEESEGHVRTGGVELAPYHEHDKVVPIELKAVLNIVSQQRVEDLIPVDGSHVHFDPSRLDPNNLMSHRHD